jgi:hypothetical protein
MTDTTNLINEALNDLEEEKTEIERRIALVKSIDWTKPVTEDEWHELCETSIRTSPLLAVLVKNIFPNAENITIGCNYAYFELYGYKIQIPNSRCRGINIATSDWYNDIKYSREHRGDPHPPLTREVMAYFDAVDNKRGWKEQAKHRLYHASTMSDFELFIKWFGKYKWKKVDRAKWEAKWEEEERRYTEKTAWYEKTEAENREKLEFVLNVLMPELDKFSDYHCSYYNNGYHLTVNEILEKEGMV